MQDTAEAVAGIVTSKALTNATNEASMLLEQMCQLEIKCEQLQKDLEGSRRRESSLQALLDGEQAGGSLVAFDVHMQVVQENKSLKAQIEQLKQDLEQLYMDDNFITEMGAAAEAGHSGSQMMSHRLASLLAPSSMDMRGSHMSFAVCSTLENGG